MGSIEMESFKEMMGGLSRSRGSWWTSEFAKASDNSENYYGYGSDNDKSRRAEKYYRNERNSRAAGTPVFRGNDGKMHEAKVKDDDVPYSRSPLRYFKDDWGIPRLASMVSQGSYGIVNKPYYLLEDGSESESPWGGGGIAGYVYRPMSKLMKVQAELQRSADEFAFDSWLADKMEYFIGTEMKYDLEKRYPGETFEWSHKDDASDLIRRYAAMIAKHQLNDWFNEGRISSQAAADPALLNGLTDQMVQERALPFVKFVYEIYPDQVKQLTADYKRFELPSQKEDSRLVRVNDIALKEALEEEAQEILKHEIEMSQQKDFDADKDGNISKIDTSIPEAWAKKGLAYEPPSKYGYGVLKTNKYGESYRSYDNEYRRILRNLYARHYEIPAYKEEEDPKERGPLPDPDEPGISEEEKLKRKKNIALQWFIDDQNATREEAKKRAKLKDLSDKQQGKREEAEKKAYADDRKKKSLDELNYQKRRKEMEEDHFGRQSALRFRALMNYNDTGLLPPDLWQLVSDRSQGYEKQNQNVNSVYERVVKDLNSRKSYAGKLLSFNKDLDDLNRLAYEAANNTNPQKRSDLNKRFYEKRNRILRSIVEITADKYYDKRDADFGNINADKLKQLGQMTSSEYVSELAKEKVQPGSGTVIGSVPERTVSVLPSRYSEYDNQLKTLEGPIKSEAKLHEMLIKGEDPRDNPAVMQHLEESGILSSGLLPTRWVRQFRNAKAMKEQRAHEQTSEGIDELYRQAEKEMVTTGPTVRNGGQPFKHIIRAQSPALQKLWLMSKNYDGDLPSDLQEKAKNIVNIFARNGLIDPETGAEERYIKAGNQKDASRIGKYDEYGFKIAPANGVRHTYHPTYPPASETPYDRYMKIGPTGGLQTTSNILRSRKNTAYFGYLMPFFERVIPKLKSEDPAEREKAQDRVTRFIKDYIYPDVTGHRKIDGIVGSRFELPKPESKTGNDKDKDAPSERVLGIKKQEGRKDRYVERFLRKLQKAGTVDIDGKPVDFLHVVDKVYDNIMSDEYGNPPRAKSSDSKNPALYETWFPYGKDELKDHLPVTHELVEYMKWDPLDMTRDGYGNMLREIVNENVPVDPNDESKGVRKRTKPEALNEFEKRLKNQIFEDRRTELKDWITHHRGSRIPLEKELKEIMDKKPEYYYNDDPDNWTGDEEYNAIRSSAKTALTRMGHQNMIRGAYEMHGIDTSKVPEPPKKEPSRTPIGKPDAAKTEPIAPAPEVPASPVVAPPVSPVVAPPVSPPVTPPVSPMPPVAGKTEPIAPVSEAVPTTDSGVSEIESAGPAELEVKKPQSDNGQKTLDSFNISKSIWSNMQNMSIREMMCAIAKSESKEGHPYGKPVQGSTFIFGSSTATLGNGKDPVMPAEIPKGETNGEGASSKEITI